MPIESRLWRVLSYIGFGIVVFLVALFVTFPDNQLKEVAAVQIESVLEKRNQANYEVEIADIDFWWLWGLEMEGVHIEKSGATKTKEAQPKKAKKSKGKSDGAVQTVGGTNELDVTIPNLAARLAPIQSLTNWGLAAKFHLGFKGGTVTGSFTRSSAGQSLYLSINDLKLKESKALWGLSGVGMFGTLRGTVDLDFQPRRFVLTGGRIQLSGSKITMGRKKIKPESLKSLIPKLQISQGYLSIPSTNFGNLEVSVLVENPGKGQPTFSIDTFRAKGTDLRLEIWGDGTLGRGLADTRGRVKMRISFSPKFLDEKGGLGPVIRRQQIFQNGKNGSWYGFVLFGQMGAPEFQPSPRAAEGPQADGGAEPVKGKTGQGNGGGDGNPPTKDQ